LNFANIFANIFRTQQKTTYRQGKIQVFLFCAEKPNFSQSTFLLRNSKKKWQFILDFLLSKPKKTSIFAG